jgi:hypothetical protein
MRAVPQAMVQPHVTVAAIQEQIAVATKPEDGRPVGRQRIGNMNALRRHWPHPWPRPRDIRCQPRTLAAPGADGTGADGTATSPACGPLRRDFLLLNGDIVPHRSCIPFSRVHNPVCAVYATVLESHAVDRVDRGRE